MPLIPALGNLNHRDYYVFEGNLDYGRKGHTGLHCLRQAFLGHLPSDSSLRVYPLMLSSIGVIAKCVKSKLGKNSVS